MTRQTKLQGPLLLGILVGGHSTRMGGCAKGLLRTTSGMTIVESLAFEFRSLFPGGRVILLGEHPDYAHLEFPRHADLERAEGPMGGVHTLLTEAVLRDATAATLVGCDMPHVNQELFGCLLHTRPEALALAPRTEGHWEPLFARFAPAAIATLNECLDARQYSLQRWLDLMNCTELTLSDSQRARLRDWDSPDDVGT